jgi:hypothetical protein
MPLSGKNADSNTGVTYEVGLDAMSCGNKLTVILCLFQRSRLLLFSDLNCPIVQNEEE